MHIKSPAMYFLLKPFYILFQHKKEKIKSENHLRLGFFQNQSESKALMVYNEHHRTITDITIEVFDSGSRYSVQIPSLRHSESQMISYEDLINPNGIPFCGILSTVTVNSSRGRRRFTVKGNNIYKK